MNFLCEDVYFSDVENTWETDSVEKPKSINGTLLIFGKVAVPQKVNE